MPDWILPILLFLAGQAIVATVFLAKLSQRVTHLEGIEQAKRAAIDGYHSLRERVAVLEDRQNRGG